MKTFLRFTLAWATFALPCFALTALPDQPMPIVEPLMPRDPPPSTLEIAPEMSILSPTTFILADGNHVASYSGLSGMRTIFLGASRKILALGNFQGYLTVRGGYGANSIKTNFSQNGVSLMETTHLNWVPISAGIKIAYDAPHFAILTPWAMVGGGTQIIHQNTDDSGLDHTFWVPHLYTSAGVTFLPAEYRDWFGGFDFGISYERSVGTIQILRGWSFDLAISLLL